jgi:tetrapyrrole methylase family protein/MazG family protein
MEINPEQALNKTLAKFTRRFEHIELKVKESGRKFGDFTLDELESFWQEAKE